MLIKIVSSILVGQKLAILSQLTQKMLPREEFSSKRGESTIYLGHFKNKEHKIENYNATAFVHSQNIETTQVALPAQGLDQTRFHKGFNRRHQSNIDNSFAKVAEANALARSLRQEDISHIRTEAIKAQDAKTGYNIINGATKGQGPPPVRPEGIKKVGDGLGPEAPNRGKSILRESGGRFFTPLGTGHNHEHRQNVLYKEGLSVEKRCGLLEANKGDMPSYGIEDQFSKSEYTRNSIVAQTGLYESRVPGKFTPRKIPNHPAGNEGIVQKWTTNIDLNNRTLQGQW